MVIIFISSQRNPVLLRNVEKISVCMEEDEFIKNERIYDILNEEIGGSDFDEENDEYLHLRDEVEAKKFVDEKIFGARIKG
jgi:hypothetical protein